jgi:hypothetical protein
MTTYHVLAAIGHFADDHRSLGVFEADSEWKALERCLAEHDQDPDLGGAPTDVAELAREEHRQLRGQLHEPGACFIVTPVAAEAHFMRDQAGVVHEAAEVERRRAVIRREFGVDIL